MMVRGMNMKIRIGFLITVFLIMLFGLSSVNAANITKLESNTTYELDMNGGNKEAVRVDLTYINETV